ncbi:MAG: addiction module protein [Proteobacteria bacterium]|nr:addiction module protein [Pseudomonadota bacterium]
MESIEQLAQKAAGLQPVDRIRLVEAILQSLDQIDPGIQEKWANESEARYTAYKNGKINSTDWPDVRKRYLP